MELLKKEDTPQDVKDVCQSVIDKLLTADGILVQIIYDEAQTYAGDPDVDKELAKADKEIAKAQEKIDEGKYDKAIDHYKKAWKHVQKALEYGEGGEGE